MRVLTVSASLMLGMEVVGGRRYHHTIPELGGGGWDGCGMHGVDNTTGHR